MVTPVHQPSTLSPLSTRRPPAFLPGLGRLVVTKCRAILRPLNKLQQRALLRVMMAEDYLLIQGMPGTGEIRGGMEIVVLVRDPIWLSGRLVFISHGFSLLHLPFASPSHVSGVTHTTRQAHL